MKLSNCDRIGSIEFVGDAVYRKIDHDYLRLITKTTTALQSLGIRDVIESEVLYERDDQECRRALENTFKLRHRRIRYISYPHEWCASMLKDAAISQISISQKLLPFGLYIKDAHPWNFLFEKGFPIFVDISSIVDAETLFQEEYLLANARHHHKNISERLTYVIMEIYKRMYIPYFIKPLLSYSIGQSQITKNEIYETSLNTTLRTFSLFTSLARAKLKLKSLINLLPILNCAFQILLAYGKLAITKDITKYFNVMHRLVSTIPCKSTNSSYTRFYTEKAEHQNLTPQINWNEKQRAIYTILSESNGSTVLDVACNTGWFSLLAANLGKEVLAFDIDEACIERLYARVKSDSLNILPLTVDVTRLSEEKRGIHDQQVMLIDAKTRFRSDIVLALGIFHHLVLGRGLAIVDVLRIFANLCDSMLILEFIDLCDPMVVNQPEFFTWYARNKTVPKGYNLEEVVRVCESMGYKVKIIKSNPDTRSLIVCEVIGR